MPHNEDGSISYYGVVSFNNYGYITVIGHIPDDLDTLAEDDYTDNVKLKSVKVDIDFQLDSDGTARLVHHLVLLKYLGGSNVTSQATANQDLETIVSNLVGVVHDYRVLKTVGPSPSYLTTLSGTSDIVGYKLNTNYIPPKKRPISTVLSTIEPRVRVALLVISIAANSAQRDGVISWRKFYKFAYTRPGYNPVRC